MKKRPSPRPKEFLSFPVDVFLIQLSIEGLFLSKGRHRHERGPGLVEVATISNTARDFKISKITVFRKDGNAQLLEETLIGAGLKRIR